MLVGDALGRAMVDLQMIPEPATLSLVAIGLAGVWLKRRR
jgi:hypothetical protein